MELDRLFAGPETGGRRFISVVEFGDGLRLASPNDPESRPWFGTTELALLLLAPLRDGAGVEAVRHALGIDQATRGD